MSNTVNMKKNVMWNTFGSVFYSACQWLITVLVVHLASYEAAGSLSLAMTTSSSFSAISLFSMRNYQVSDVRNEYSSRIYVGSRIITCILAMLSCFMASFWIGDSRSEIACINAFMLIRIAEALVDVLHGVNQKYNRYDLIGKSYILRGLSTIIIFCLGLKVTQNLTVTIIMIAIINMVIALLYDWNMTGRLENIVPVIYNRKLWILLKTCLPIVIFSFLLSLENLIAKKVLQVQYGKDCLGIYSSMASPTLVVQVFASVAFNPFLPGLVETYVQGDKEKFRKQLNKVLLFLVLMAIVVTFGALLVGRLGLTILFGKSILEYYDLFMPIVWVTIFTACIWILCAIVVGLRKIKLLLVGMIIDFIFCVLLANPCLKYFGMNGASIVQIIVMGAYTIYLALICMSCAKVNARKSEE